MGRIKTTYNVLIIVFCLFFAPVSIAKVLVYEGFDYPVGSLGGQGDPNNGWTGSWAVGTAGTSWSVEANSLDMTNLSFTPTGGAAIGQSTANRDFTGIDFDLWEEGTYYVSYLVRRTGWGASDGAGEWLDVHLRTSNFAKVATWGISSSEQFLTTSLGATQVDGDANTTDVYFVVGKVVINKDGTNDEIYLKVYSESDTIDSTEPVTWSASGGAEDNSDLATRLTLWAGDDNDVDGLYQAEVDEIRIATSWEEAVGVGFAPTIASNPQPEDYTTGISAAGVVLTWQPGSDVLPTGGHQLYFGTDLDAVTNATTANPMGVYQGALDVNMFEPNVLTERTYYWRVDEVGSGGTYKGNVWRFISSASVSIDSFESYTDTSDLLTVWDADGGATLELETTDPNYVYEGLQSMELLYNSYYGDSLATLVYTTPQDWSNNGDLRALDIHFRGQSSNSTDEQLLVSVEDNNSNSATVYYGASSDLASTSWITWHINLDDFVGVNMEEVTRFTIGLVDGGDDGMGLLYFDSISLYPCRGGGAQMDFNGDCIVNIADFAIFAEDWLLKKLWY